MPINWSLEALKIRLNASYIGERQNFNYKSVFAGVSLGVITPNRLGAFLGTRQWFTNKKIYTGLHLYANLSQFVATLLMGSIGFVALERLPVSIPFYIYITLIVVGCAVYFLLPKMNLNKLKFLQKFQTKVSLVHQLKLLLLSVIRSFVICLQYSFILLVFNKGQFSTIFFWTSIYYLYLTVIPAWFLHRLLIRESLALLVFLPLFENSIAILFSSLLLWLLNLGIPALFGVYFLSKQKDESHARII